MAQNYSYSKLDTYIQCKFKYKLKYIDGHYLYCDSIATAFGTLIHTTEEAIAKAIQNNEPINYIELKNNFIKTKYDLAYQFPKEFYELDKSNRTYEDKSYYYLTEGIYRLERLMRANPTYKIVGIEQAFEFKFQDEYNFKGYIDRIFYDTATDKYIIQDIKSYAVEMEKDKLTTPLQFVVYVLAAKKLYNIQTEQIICQYDLPLCDLTHQITSNGFVDRGIKKLDKTFKSILAKDFEPNPSPLCHWCEFCSTNDKAPDEGKYLCPYFCHWTREHKVFSHEYD